MDEQWYRVVMRGGDVRVYKLVDGNLEHNSMGFPLSAADRLCESVEPVVVQTKAALEQAPAPAMEVVKDGEYPMVPNACEDGDFLYVHGNEDDSVCTWVEYGNDSVMLDLGMVLMRPASARGQEDE